MPSAAHQHYPDNEVFAQARLVGAVVVVFWLMLAGVLFWIVRQGPSHPSCPIPHPRSHAVPVGRIVPVTVVLGGTGVFDFDRQFWQPVAGLPYGTPAEKPIRGTAALRSPDQLIVLADNLGVVTFQPERAACA